MKDFEMKVMCVCTQLHVCLCAQSEITLDLCVIIFRELLVLQS